MPTPIYRQQQGSTLWIAAAGMPATTLANNAISASAIARLQSTTYSGALLYDIYTSGSFGTDPAGAGALQLIVVNRSPDGVQGPTPIAATARNVYTFGQAPQSTSAKVYCVMAVPVPLDCDLWMYNNATGYTFTYTNTMNSSASAFSVYAWTPGS